MFTIPLVARTRRDTRSRASGVAAAFPTVAALALASTLGAWVPAQAADAPAVATNLIVNGDAESGLTGWTAYEGWPTFEAGAYGPRWISATTPGPEDRGTHLFVGGGGVEYAAAFQRIDLSAQQALIAQGASYSLSGWLGGWSDQKDNAMVWTTFHDAAGVQLADAAIGPLMPRERGNVTGLFHRETRGVVPAGTAYAVVALTMERLGGGDNDGYADNLAFTVSAVPEPSTTTLMLIAGLSVAVVAGRRHRR